MYKHGLICGRWQPLHNGHIKLIQKALKECQHLTIVIGSAQDEINQRNPYTYHQRYLMIKNVFLDDLVYKHRMEIVPKRDINNPPEWACNILGHVLIHSDSNDPVDVYYAGSEYDASLFKEHGIPVEITKRELSNLKSGTEIRDMILRKDNRWKEYTPEVNWSLISGENQ